MNIKFSKKLLELRKENSLTQQELAKKVGVSFQAVSKWETGQTIPDVNILIILAGIFSTSIDNLLGYTIKTNTVTNYELYYNRSYYYWGLEPSSMCYEIMKLRPPIKPYKILEIGCGEGKDAVFFAKNGYLVTAFDITYSGIEKAKKLADYHKVDVNFFKADLLNYNVDEEFDIIYSSGVLNYIPYDLREEIIYHYQEKTSQNGIHALNVFVHKPFIPNAPDFEIKESLWKSGELFSYYSDWYFHQCKEKVFDCNSSDVPHKHCINILLAEKF